MPKFRMKPVEIEAIQFTQELAIAALIDKEPGPFGLHVSGDYHWGRREVHRAWVPFKTMEGTKRADIGDWIIRDGNGVRPCDPDTFAALYEPAEG